MARCEDFPCCGHELGCCPDYDEETGKQLNMVCVCGAKLPITNRFSICDGCMKDPDGAWDYDYVPVHEDFQDDDPDKEDDQ